MIAEIITLGLFLAGLGLCIFTGIQILYALLFGLACFSLYTLSRGYSVRETCSMLGEGMGKVKNILIIFVLIGSLTSIWRTCGTIPFILYHAMGLIDPRFFVLCTFLLCSMMSFLTGTSFGTASTMGVICMLISTRPVWIPPSQEERSSPAAFLGTAVPPCPPAPSWCAP